MNIRTRLIKLVTFLGGIYFFLEFVLPGTVFGVKIDTYHDQISNGFITVGAMAAGLGLINLLMQHGSKIIFRRKEWVYSAALLSGLVIMIAVTFQDWSGTRRVAEEVAEISRLSDFAERIKSDHEKQVEGVLPAARAQRQAQGGGGAPAGPDRGRRGRLRPRPFRDREHRPPGSRKAIWRRRAPAPAGSEPLSGS